MASVLEVVAGRVTNPGATVTALTADTDNTFTTRNFDLASSAYVEGLWALGATAGVVRLRSSKLHDQIQAIRFRTIAATVRTFFADGVRARMYPNDTFNFELSGGGAEVDMAALLMYYADIPGPVSRYVTWDQIKSRIVTIAVNEVAVTGPTVAGDWSAGNAFNATNDNLIANTDYAVIGYQTDTNVCAVGIRGVDTANLRAGGPGTTESIETRDWFKSLSDMYGTPHIPVISSANKASTLVSVAHTATGGTINVGLVLAQLAPGG